MAALAALGASGAAVPVPAGQAGTIVFSHANGYPAGTYRQLFEAWRAAGWRVLALPMFAHNPAYPTTSNWPNLRDELLAFVQQHAAGQPVHLVGHSLGGYLSMLAACHRPANIQSVVLVDSPLVYGWKAKGLHFAKATGLVRHGSPGKVSQRRRWQWPSAAAAYQHYAAKPIFARWAPGVLADYLAAGLEPDPTALNGTIGTTGAAGTTSASSPGAVRLVFTREAETQLYNTIAHHMTGLLRRHPPQCPVHFIGGRQSAEVKLTGLGLTQRATQGRITWLDGTHLFPMERPAETAAAVLAAVTWRSGTKPVTSPP
jgi:pimeloyl-ACP methyl ester carboxylesterase